MNNLLDKFRWLNRIEATHLSPRSSATLENIRFLSSRPDQQDALIEDTVHFVRRIADQKEVAEILGNCSVIRAERNEFQESSRLMHKSSEIYDCENDDHRRAVTQWCLFLIRTNIHEFAGAYENGRLARSLFTDQIDDYKKRLPDNPDLIWYKERVAEMDCELALTPEEGYEWINRFSQCRLNEASQKISKKIYDLINRKCFDDAYSQIETLRRVSKRSIEPMETAEAMAFCGLSLFEMGNRPESIRYLRIALANAVPASHEHTSIRWMLGLVQFSLPVERTKGISNLEESVHLFDDLRRCADQKNNQDEVSWYDIQLSAMRKNLNNLINSDC